tara:strand:- start:1402 stop:2943 length:1542 start_codon:yes stop_codon:yes gene_type:complete
MPKTQPHPDEQQVIAAILNFRDDPLAFVLYAFPWAQAGSPLEKWKGPRQWQINALTEMRDHIRKNNLRQTHGDDPELMQMAIASGRGIGKSAFLAWVALWLFSTLPSSTTIVSANTEAQLRERTFPEIRKWATMSIHNRWFDPFAMSIRPQPWLVESLKKTTQFDDAYWYIQAQLWSEETPDAYAGAHSQVGMSVLFDEGSGIPGCIWPVAKGYFTDLTTHRFFIAISNPRNPSGEFFECFHAGRDQWNHSTIDGRSVKENDQKVYQDIIDRYGVDSDEARVEVYGQFPRQGDENFISRGEVDDAVAREVTADPGSPLLMGVDPARMGQDKAVIWFRKGRDARSIPPISYAKCGTQELASYCAEAIEKYHPDHVFVESDGIGGPVIEAMRAMGYRVIDVHVSKAAQDKQRYYLHRTEVWGRMKEWIPSACLPKHDDLITDLCGMRYAHKETTGQIALWPKEKMKREGFASPDYADALAMTFSKPVSRSDTPTSKRRARRNNRIATNVDIDVFT